MNCKPFTPPRANSVRQPGRVPGLERRVALLAELNENDNRMFTKFFNSLLNTEAVRSFTNEAHEVAQYDNLLGSVERLSVRDVQTVSVLNAGQAIIFSAALGVVLSLSVKRVLAGALTVGDVVATVRAALAEAAAKPASS